MGFDYIVCDSPAGIETRRADGDVLRRRGDGRDQPRGLLGARLRPHPRPARRQDQPRRAGGAPIKEHLLLTRYTPADGQARRDAERRRRPGDPGHPAARRDPGVEGRAAVVQQGRAGHPRRDDRRRAGLPGRRLPLPRRGAASTASSRRRSAASSAACSANRTGGHSCRFFDYFRRAPKTASTRQGPAVDHRGARARRHPHGCADYLPQLQQELLAVIARYEKIDLSNVTVNLDRHEGGEVLELNITLPESEPAPPPARARAP